MEPAYLIPLSDDELQSIGRITTMGGQIEFFMDDIICLINNIDRSQLYALCGPNIMLGTKAQILEKSLPKINSNDKKRLAKQIVEKIKIISPNRNMIIHGMWGINYNTKNPKKNKVASMQRRKAKTPFFASKLPDLEKDLCELTYLVTDLENDLRGFARLERGQQRPKFLFGKGPPPGYESK